MSISEIKIKKNKTLKRLKKCTYFSQEISYNRPDILCN